MNKTISLIIPIYNEGEKLKKNLNTFVKSLNNNVEIILVDDGSTDISSKICDDFSQNFSNIKVIHKINEGIVAARKSGVNVAKNDYVVFADGDDFVANDYFFQLEKIVESDYDYYFLNNFTNKAGTNDFSLEKSFFKDRILTKNEAIDLIVSGKAGAVWDKVFKRSILKNALNKSKITFTYGDDIYINLLYLTELENICYKNIGIYYHLIDSNTSVSSPKNALKKLRDIDVLYKYVYELLENNFNDSMIINHFDTVQIANYVKNLGYARRNGIKNKELKLLVRNSYLCNNISMHLNIKSIFCIIIIKFKLFGIAKAIVR